jgi:hypothetical protein
LVFIDPVSTELAEAGPYSSPLDKGTPLRPPANKIFPLCNSVAVWDCLDDFNVTAGPKDAAPAAWWADKLQDSAKIANPTKRDFMGLFFMKILKPGILGVTSMRKQKQYFRDLSRL